MPSANGPQDRIMSPAGVGSTLTTSAPRSARMVAQKGPAKARDKSRTRIPANGNDIFPPKQGLFPARSPAGGRVLANLYTISQLEFNSIFQNYLPYCIEEQ